VQYLVLVAGGDEAGGLRHEDLLLEFSIQERALDIHVMDLVTLVRHQGQ
jgi:hypothetical protein